MKSSESSKIVATRNLSATLGDTSARFQTKLKDEPPQCYVGKSVVAMKDVAFTSTAGTKGLDFENRSGCGVAAVGLPLDANELAFDINADPTKAQLKFQKLTFRGGYFRDEKDEYVWNAKFVIFNNHGLFAVLEGGAE